MPFYSYLEGGVKFFVGLLQILNNKPQLELKTKVFSSKVEKACDYSFFTVQQVFPIEKIFTAKGEMQYAYVTSHAITFRTLAVRMLNGTASERATNG